MRHFLVCLVGVVALAVGLAPPAHAEDGDDEVVGNSTGGGWVPGVGAPDSPAERARAEAKMQDALAYNQAVMEALRRPGGIDAQTLSSPQPVSTPEDPCPATKRVLNVQHAGQIKNYYCAPTTGFMILRYQREGRSAYNGASLSQRHVAGAAHMRTDINGRTSWTNQNRPFRKGLNRWRGDSFYVRTASPSNAKFRAALRSDIDNHMPFGVSTLEFLGGRHYNEHPDDTIGHWIVGQGYRNNLDTTSFDDPAANASGLSSNWDDAVPNFAAGTNYLNGTFVEPHGIVW